MNAALRVAEGEFVGIFDADHHPMAGAFDRAWRWIADGADVVQGHCVIRNGDDSALAKLVAVEFEQIYAVAHPGRAAAARVRHLRRLQRLLARRRRSSGSGCAAPSSPRTSRHRCGCSYAGGRIVNDPGLVSRELAPDTLGALWKQRMRWAQGWFQVSCLHLWPILRSSALTLRQKVGATYLLGWREVYPWVVADGLAAARLPGLA